jgi:hypothetical protein
LLKESQRLSACKSFIREIRQSGFIKVVEGECKGRRETRERERERERERKRERI